jgi:hypothetical protein
MIQPRYGHGVVKLGNQVYALGGRHQVDLESIEVCNLEIDKWQFALNLPVPVWCCTATVHRQSIYLSGFFITEVIQYDYKANTSVIISTDFPTMSSKIFTSHEGDLYIISARHSICKLKSDNKFEILKSRDVPNVYWTY